MKKQYDVIIVGGGAVGASVALAIGQCNRQVLLIEKRSLDHIRPTLSMNEKTLALSYSSIKIYEALGVLKFFIDKSVSINEVHVTQQGQFGSCRLNHKEQGVDQLGAVVGAHDLEFAIYQTLKACPFVTLMQADEPLQLQRHLNHWEGQDCQAPLLIASDGAQSSLRNKVFIQCNETDYQHCALALNMKMSKMPKGLALERFLDEGAIALLPWQNDWMTCVWTLKKDEAALAMALSDNEFKVKCEQVLGKMYSNIEEMGTRSIYPLQMKLAKNQFSSRFLLMGNAAHSLHPIAAQGLNLSLRDVWQLRSQLRQDPTHLVDMGTEAFLQEYDNKRKADQNRIIRTTSNIASIMANQRVPALLRAMGITLLDTLLPLKIPFTKLSMGLKA